MPRTTIVALAFGVAAVLLLTWVVAGSQYFDQCIGSYGTNIGDQYKAAHEHAILIVHPIYGAHLVERCAVRFVHYYSETIVALFTAMLTVATAILAGMGVVQIVTSRIQLRAYVMPNSAAIFDGATMTPPLVNFTNVPSVRVMFKNSGQTPAYHIKGWVKIDVMDPANEDKLQVIWQDAVGNSAAAPGAEFSRDHVFGRALSPAEVTDIQMHAKKIYVYGRIEYETLGRRRQTDFRLFWRGTYPPPAGHNLTHCQDGNEAD